MPVILTPQDVERWLDPEFQNIETLQKLLAPYEPKLTEAFPVSTAVNSPMNQGKELRQPVLA